MTKQQTLLPIGTRVTHFDGKRESTHGKGTILAYNGVSPSSYIRENFKEAVNMAAGAGLLGGLVSAMYDGQRYPYIVQFDPREPYVGESKHSEELRLKYPRGYKDFYGVEDTFAIEPNENIFPTPQTMVMMRVWWTNGETWGAWIEASNEAYEAHKNDPNYQFCVRPEFNKE